MNDFTKQELEYIVKGLGWVCFHKEEINKLMTKVKAMIDNYCEDTKCHHGVTAEHCFVCEQDEQERRRQETA